MKTLLYFIPFNIMKNNAGAISRAWALLEAFAQNGITVDYVHSNDIWGASMNADEQRELLKSGLVRSIYSVSKKPESILAVRQWLSYGIRRLGRELTLKRSLPNFATTFSRYQFEKILRENSYDYIVISYAYWVNLIRNSSYIKNAKLIIDTHDFLTAQEQNRRKFSIGKGFEEEMKRLAIFDQIWTISTEEQYLFSQFTSSPVTLLPFCTEDRSSNTTEKRYDIIYVASDNPHNLKAADWFFREVYPLLTPSVKWCVIGSIHKYVPDKKNIHKVPYAESLDGYYSRAKLAICPMLSGTGVKIKVIEALAYGLPVICSPRGVDGLVNKTGNGCVVAESAAAFAKNIATLLSVPDQYEKMQRQAISFFQKNHTKEVFLQVMSETLK